MKNFKKLLSSQSGVSLIEVTAAAAISVIISLGIMKTNETGQKGMTKVTTDMDFKLWQANVLQRHLGDPTVCRNNFGGVAANSPHTLTTVNDGQTPTPQPFFVAGNNIEGTGGSWNAISMTRGAFMQDGSSDTLGRCMLTVRAKRTKKSFGPEIREINIPMSCTRQTAVASSPIQECTITSDGSDTLWTQKVAVGGNPEYIYNASTVLVGPEAAAGELKARLEISDSNGIEFPAALSGVETSVRITNQNHALVFNDSGALYEGTDGCFNIGSGKSGTLISGYKHCSSGIMSGVAVSSQGFDFRGGSNSAAIASIGVIIDGETSLASGKGVTITGTTSQAFGADISVTHDNSIMLGSVMGSSNSAMQIQASSDHHQFTGNYQAGYRFVLGPSNSGENTYITPPETPLVPGEDYSLLATEGNLWVGNNTVIEGNLEVKGNIIGGSTDQFFASVSLSGGTGSNGGITCVLGGGGTGAECSCDDPNYRIISGGTVLGDLTHKIIDSRPISLTEYRVYCADASNNLRQCVNFSGICSR
jgi:hypothetical protein